MHNANSTPLAQTLRPKCLAEFVGQTHLVGEGRPIRQMIESGRIVSMIFWGPPGSGKTTLARVIANEIGAQFHDLSAVSAGKADIKRIIESSRITTNPDSSNFARNTLFSTNNKDSDSNIRINSKNNSRNSIILFLDEIHRFNKAQQDFLLPYVEDGTLILIGATTENPSFEVNSALLSRSQVYVLSPHTKDELNLILEKALNKFKSSTSSPYFRGRSGGGITIAKDARSFLLEYANGDARTMLNVLENTTQVVGDSSPYFRGSSGGGKLTKKLIISLKDLKNTLQSKHLRYDTKGEEHYNTISAFIKSMRASDPDAALYYLARMVEAGEDPKFIARRMVIFASEDIGMAQPTALVVANEVFRSVEIIGYPECAINLAHGVVYLATAKKDRRAYDGLRSAQADIAQHGNLEIPLHLRNAPTKLMKDIGYGRNYEPYPEKKNMLPSKLKGKKYYK